MVGSVAIGPAFVESARHPSPPLLSPLSGRVLEPCGPHMLGDGVDRWPVIDGIAYLRTGRDALRRRALDRLDAGDVQGALIQLLADQDDWARTPPPDVPALADLVSGRDRLSFRDAMDRLAFGAVSTYFAHRWSDPTFLAGLALTEAHWTGPGRVFELACGAGHHLRELARVGVAVLGGDVVFAKLWLARHWIVPDAALVCFDAQSLWPVPAGSADLAVCHDAFYFLPEKAHVAASLRRTVGPEGSLLISHAHNAATQNYSSGAALTVREYAALFPGCRLYDDDELTRALVEQRPPRAAAAPDLAEAEAVGIVAGPAASMAPRPAGGPITLPVPGTRLRRNPLYQDAGAEARIVWPSERYEAEYGARATYPLQVRAPVNMLLDAADPVAKNFARVRVMLDLPERW